MPRRLLAALLLLIALPVIASPARAAASRRVRFRSGASRTWPPSPASSRSSASSIPATRSRRRTGIGSRWRASAPVEGAENPAALAQALEGFFRPLAPTLRVYPPRESARRHPRSCGRRPAPDRSKWWPGGTSAAISTARRRSSPASGSTITARPASARWCRRSRPAICGGSGCGCAPRCGPRSSREASPSSACGWIARAASRGSSTTWRTGRSATPPGRPTRSRGTWPRTPSGSSSCSC